MDIRPIFSTLRRHKTAATLIVIEIALTCAIVCNAVFVIGNRIEQISTPSGMAEAELLHIRLAGIQRVDNADALTLQDLATLRALAGLKSATIVNQLPFGHEFSDISVSLAPDKRSSTITAAFYSAGEDMLETMGVRLLEGRRFAPEEYRPQSQVEHDPNVQLPAVMVDRATAARLFPGKPAIGQTVYLVFGTPSRIVGVVDHLAWPQPRLAGDDYVVIVPVRPSFAQGSYLLRVDPARRHETLRAAVAALESLDGRRIVTEQKLFEEMRREHYQQDRWMAVLLAAVCLALLVVTAFGIVGLASFWVQQRKRMIGVRRALGASKRQIVGYFQTENFLLTGIGITLGMAGAYAINQALMTHYELPRLPWTYLPIGAVLLWGLGQIAVLAPALRAAALPPAAVMRGA
jgi:putative ABC transport system permease protein